MGSWNFATGSDPQQGDLSMSRATPHIDRRALIRAGATATLAAGATLNLGAVALTRAANGPNPDAELLALGAQVDGVLEEFEAQRARDRAGAHDSDDVWNDLHGRFFPLARDILSRTAHTAEGLTIQARAVREAASDLWEGEAEQTEEKMFIEAACRFVGIKPPAVQS
jgi:hypothetical protein